MSKFKSGDKVRALIDDDLGYPLAFLKNDIFTVNSSFASSFVSEYFVTLNELLIKYPSHAFSESSFELESLTSGSALRAYNNTSNAFYPKINQIQPRQRVKLLAFNQKDLDNAKKLLQIEYGNDTVDEAQLKETYKQVFNLSEDEIQSILKEIEDENVLQQYYFQGMPRVHYPIPTGTITDYSNETKPQVNGNVCKHEMVLYQGLSETFNHCKFCGQKE